MSWICSHDQHESYTHGLPQLRVAIDGHSCLRWKVMRCSAGCQLAPQSPAPCSVSVSCRGVQGHEQAGHCTVTTKNGSTYEAYDGGPSGSIWWSKLIVAKGAGVPPRPGTFTVPIGCTGPGPDISCVQKGADAINNNNYIYSFPLQNSNDAARMMVFSCGIMNAPIP
jgi:hypothetical protein